MATPAVHAKELADDEPIATPVLSSEPVPVAEEPKADIPAIAVESSPEDDPVRSVYVQPFIIWTFSYLFLDCYNRGC